MPAAAGGFYTANLASDRHRRVGRPATRKVGAAKPRPKRNNTSPAMNTRRTTRRCWAEKSVKPPASASSIHSSQRFWICPLRPESASIDHSLMPAPTTLLASSRPRSPHRRCYASLARHIPKLMFQRHGIDQARAVTSPGSRRAAAFFQKPPS
jgi:hypothetical protein